MTFKGGILGRGARRVLRCLLVAGPEMGSAGNGRAQVLVRIHRGVANAHLVVQVRTGHASRGADVADDLAALNFCPAATANPERCP